jgi:hypothetical protein
LICGGRFVENVVALHSIQALTMFLTPVKALNFSAQVHFRKLFIGFGALQERDQNLVELGTFSPWLPL